MVINRKIVKSQTYLKLPKIQKAIYLLILLHADKNGKNSNPSVNELSRGTGYQKNAILRALNNMTKNGAISVKRSYGKSSIYKVNQYP